MGFFDALKGIFGATAMAGVAFSVYKDYKDDGEINFSFLANLFGAAGEQAAKAISDAAAGIGNGIMGAAAAVGLIDGKGYELSQNEGYVKLVKALKNVVLTCEGTVEGYGGNFLQSLDVLRDTEIEVVESELGQACDAVNSFTGAAQAFGQFETNFVGLVEAVEAIDEGIWESYTSRAIEMYVDCIDGSAASGGLLQRYDRAMGAAEDAVGEMQAFHGEASSLATLNPLCDVLNDCISDINKFIATDRPLKSAVAAAETAADEFILDIQDELDKYAEMESKLEEGGDGTS